MERVRIGPLSKIAIRKGWSASGEGGGRGRKRGGHSSLETSIPIFRGDERRMSTSRARRRFLSANAMKCVSLFFLLPPPRRRRWLFLESICVRGLCVERLSTSKGSKKKISGRPDALSPDYRDRSFSFSSVSSGHRKIGEKSDRFVSFQRPTQ